MRFSKAINIIGVSFLIFFVVSSNPMQTQASSATFVEALLSCGPTQDKKNKRFTAKMFGAISGSSIALTRSWRGAEPDFSPFVGYIHKNKLIIKGEGRQQNSSETWQFYFSKKSEGTIKQDLQAGIEGKGGSRKCKLLYIQEVPSQTAFLGKNLVVENARLSKQVKDLNSKTVNENNPALIAEIDSLKKQISELESQISNQEASSENLVQMANVISALKDEVSKKEGVIADLNSEVAGLEARVVSNENANQVTIEDLKAQLSEKDADLQSLTTALRTLHDTPAPKSSCPEPSSNQGGGGSNDPIIKYLEGKNAELTKQLENCGERKTETAQGNNVPKPQPKPKKQVPITDTIFANQWQLSDAVKCGSGSYTIYDRKLGNVFVLNGKKQISPNSSDVKITQLADNKIRIVTETYANDMFKQINNGQPFAIMSSVEDITVVSESQIVTERTMKQLDTSRFMANPTDKYYNTSKEGGTKTSCGLLANVKQSSRTTQPATKLAEKKKKTVKENTLRNGERACLPKEYDFLKKIYTFAGFKIPFEKRDCIHKDLRLAESFYGKDEHLSGWNSVYYKNPSRLQTNFGAIPKFCVLIRGGRFEMHRKKDCLFM